MIGNGQNIYIVDDEPEIRGLISRLAQSLGHRAEALSDAETLLARLKPDAAGCIVLDLWLPGRNGMETQRELNLRGFNLPVIFTSGYADVSIAVEAMKAGAYDFIEKPFSFQRMTEAICGALLRDQQTREHRRAVQAIRARAAELSKRELEVLHLVADGLGSSEIAARLGIQTKTIEVHRSHIIGKMNARNTADLVRMYHFIQGEIEVRTEERRREIA